MSAWAEQEGQQIKDSERKFEDNFVSKEFQKLDDSEEYLKVLGNFSENQSFQKLNYH